MVRNYGKVGRAGKVEIMTYINVTMTEKESGFDRIEPIKAENEITALEEAAEIWCDICEGFRIEK